MKHIVDILLNALFLLLVFAPAVASAFAAMRAFSRDTASADIAGVFLILLTVACVFGGIAFAAFVDGLTSDDEEGEDAS